MNQRLAGRKALLHVLLAGAFVAVMSAPVCAADEAAMVAGSEAPAGAVWLDTLDLSKMSQGWGSPHAGKSVDDNPIRLHGQVYPHGIGTHARSEWEIDLKGGAERFVAMVGVDDEKTSKGTVVFTVEVDGKPKVNSPVMRGGDPPQLLTVDLRGAKRMTLLVEGTDDGTTNDHADWAGAMLVLAPGAKEKPEAALPPAEPLPEIATGTPPETAIHSALVVGGTPGRDFLYRIPATGERPIRFSATNLPPGISLDASTGILSGTLPTTSALYVARIKAEGPRGTATRQLRILAGEHRLAQTPPMGWNSWNAWGTAVDEAKIKSAADWIVRSGLADHGFQYVNIDDAWEKDRNEKGEMVTNEKFPDMKRLADYVHSKGLKIGIYSSPGPKTCGGYEGSYQHEQQDANAYARWGIDYLKYDWCSYGKIAKDGSLEELQKPYIKMRQALDNCGRDIVYSLCQYGMGQVWQWGNNPDIHGNLWRTTGDITDTWASMSSIGFGQEGLSKYAGPGHWNDPDMLVVGKVGWGPNLHPTKLTPNEQLTHISLWSMLSAPLLIGCDLSQMDTFTLTLLTNDEVLDINQDPLGKPANRVAKDGDLEVWSRTLWDGSVAVGLFNRGRDQAKVTAKWSDLGLGASQPVRDLWKRKDLGNFSDSFSADVPRHGVVLVKIGIPKVQKKEQ